jgi:hypothetical protein
VPTLDEIREQIREARRVRSERYTSALERIPHLRAEERTVDLEGAEGSPQVQRPAPRPLHPEAAQRLIDWLGTEEGMRVAAEERALVTRDDIEGTIDFEPNFIDYDAAWAAEHNDRLIEEWIERFGA